MFFFSFLFTYYLFPEKFIEITYSHIFKKGTTNLPTLCNDQEWLQKQVPPGTTLTVQQLFRDRSGSSCWIFLATTRGETGFSSINCLVEGKRKKKKPITSLQCWRHFKTTQMFNYCASDHTFTLGCRPKKRRERERKKKSMSLAAEML